MPLISSRRGRPRSSRSANCRGRYLARGKSSCACRRPPSIRSISISGRDWWQCPWRFPTSSPATWPARSRRSARTASNSKSAIASGVQTRDCSAGREWPPNLPQIDEAWLYPTPALLQDTEAAAMALTGITAHLGLFQFGQLKAGEVVYVPGGSGGVGSMVIQMAKAAGARVATSAGSPDRVELCQRLGADLALNYKTDDIPGRLREFSPEGIDVWYETQREPNLELSIPLLRKHGRMVLMAGRTAKPALPLGAFYPRNCAIYGFAMFNATAQEQARVCGRHGSLDRGRRAQADRGPGLPAIGRRRRRALPGRKHPERRGLADR